jgi:hypothetical protein
MPGNTPTMEEMINEINSLRTELTTLQNSQTGMSATQVQTLLTAAIRAAQPTGTPPQPTVHLPVVFNPGDNTILTARARIINPNAPAIPNEDNTPTPGAPNIKSTKPPTPFLGNKEDARPFLDRVDAWFALIPETYRLTRSRILATCGLISSRPADAWAVAVLNSITRNEDTPYYYDSWVDFKEEFLRNFGIANEQEEALNKIMRITQGTADLSVFTAEFQRLKGLSKIPDDTAVREYRRALDRKTFYQVSMLIPAPTTLKGWIDSAHERNRVTQDARTFDTINRQQSAPANRSSFPRSPAHVPSHFQPRNTATVYRPPHYATRDPNAMDVDVEHA